ncbi:hypothetical protein [Catenuloplanes indicus]|uniref:RNase H-like nuclease (RuvC/YqgF family) n=1 Tax=Catenuloplanes indicus TaxID=137267 RepID=A0AAE3WAW6_9ACTN|nr:hypothetical protein [Catenuloplanes indicus]MDQ0371635.1 putative RNase H-like nuclease (RuvC/YqgF family) [Catenuloplanes indicus]
MTGPTGWVLILVAAIGGLGGLGALLNAMFSRRKSKADAAQVITGTAMEWIAKFEKAAESAQEQAEAAQAQARAAREQMQAAQVQIERVTAEARALAAELQALRTAILRPDASLETLRGLVQRQSANGRG